jgi:AcrR family transcriptional regulator
VSEDRIAIFKDADRIDERIGRHVLDEGGDACRARPDLQVVLDVFVRIDIRERNRISGLKRLQEIDDLLFTAGPHGSSRTGSHCNNGPSGPLFASLRGKLSDNVAMGRRKLFTREDVLNKTIPVFWKHGLAETSVQDLEQATGVRKSGLYAEFKDKEDLFVASMRQYFDMLTARGALTKQPLGWDNVEGFLKVCYGSWGQKGCFSVNSMREFADLPPKARQIMIGSMTKAHQLLIDNLTAASGEAGDNESLADLIITFFCGICLEQNLSPDRAQVTKKIERFMKLIRGM